MKPESAPRDCPRATRHGLHRGASRSLSSTVSFITHGATRHGGAPASAASPETRRRTRPGRPRAGSASLVFWRLAVETQAFLQLLEFRISKTPAGLSLIRPLAASLVLWSLAGKLQKCRPRCSLSTPAPPTHRRGGHAPRAPAALFLRVIATAAAAAALRRGGKVALDVFRAARCSGRRS